MWSIIFVALLLFGIGIAGLTLWKIFDVVSNSINKNESSHSEERFDRLANAFITHKKQMEQRMQNLEAIIADESRETGSSKSFDKPSHESIEIEKSETNDGNQHVSNLSNKQRTE